MTIHRNETPTVAEQVASLEEGYANLLLENANLGNEVQDLTKAVRELEDQQAITRQAYQNLLAEKDTTIADLDATVAEKNADIKTSNEIIMDRDRVLQAKLLHIERLDEALNHAKECNDRLDHQLELAHRQTATSVRIEGDKDRDSPLGDPPLERIGPVLRYGDVRLARHLFHNLHYPAIRALLGVEACRMLDAALRADREVSD